MVYILFRVPQTFVQGCIFNGLVTSPNLFRDGAPARVGIKYGITWREDKFRGGGVMISQIVPGGAGQ